MLLNYQSLLEKGLLFIITNVTIKIIQQTGIENIKTYQVEVVIFSSKFSQLISNQILTVKEL